MLLFSYTPKLSKKKGNEEEESSHAQQVWLSIVLWIFTFDLTYFSTAAEMGS